MKTIAICQLLFGADVFRLSTGLPVMEGGKKIVAPRLRVMHPMRGVVDLLLTSSDPGTSDPRQAWSAVTPANRRLQRDLQVWEDRNRSLPFASLSSPSLFWVEDAAYTHVLMDAASRRLVGVRPFDPDLCGPVWGRVKTGLTNPSEFVTPVPPDDGLIHIHPQAVEMWRRLNGRVMYTCLHPCPARPGEAPPTWCWEGLDAVRAEVNDDLSFEIPFELAVDQEERTLGLA